MKTIIILLSLLLLTSTRVKYSGVQSTQFHGQWVIDKLFAVNVKTDSLDLFFDREDANSNINFYNEHIPDWDEPLEDFIDSAYSLQPCMKKTFRDLFEVKLEINENDYSQNAILSCWGGGFTHYEEIVNGKWEVNNDTIQLLASDGRIMTKLVYNDQTKKLRSVGDPLLVFDYVQVE